MIFVAFNSHLDNNESNSPQIKILLFFILSLFFFAKICVHLRFN